MVLNKGEAEKLAKKIFSLNDKIRFVAFTSEKLIFHSMKEGVKSYTSNEVDIKLGEIITPIAAGIFENFKKYFGDFEYLLIKFNKVNLFAIPFSKGLFTMTTEPDYRIENLIEVKKVLNEA
jgi:hypothetical protein